MSVRVEGIPSLDTENRFALDLRERVLAEELLLQPNPLYIHSIRATRLAAEQEKT